LKQYEKYEQLTPEKARTLIKNPTSGKRYCLMITTQLKNKKDGKALVDLYNHPSNKNGAICQIMLASQKFNEGLDLRAVKHIHIMEPLLTQNMVQQTVGRARRFCSHGDFKDRKDWNVTIHHYLSNIPEKSKKDTPTSTKQNINSQKTLNKLQANLNKIKGVRGKQEDRKTIKELMKLIKDEKKPVKRGRKKQNEIDTNVPAIDSKVQQKSYKDDEYNTNILDAMRSQAIDCKVMSAFHNMNSSKKVRCTGSNVHNNMKYTKKRNTSIHN
jgi:hypothetical protein